MKEYILKRIGLMLVTFVILVFITFYVIKLLPDNYEPPFGTDPNWWEMVKIREGYNRPIIEQFGLWIRNIFTEGSFGYSRSQNRDSFLVLKDRIPVTVKINLVPFLISVPIGIFFGVLAALKKNKWQDHAISLFVMLFISVPSFVVAVLLQYYFVYKWKILPYAFVLSETEALGNVWGDFLSRILPTLVLSVGIIAGWTRTLRAELTEVLTSEFMLLAKSKGLSSRQATVRHGLRNAFVPFAPAIIGGFISLLGGSYIIEQAFRIPGVGGIYLTAFNALDYPLIMLVMMFYTFVGLLAGIVGDISYGFIDPRIKMGGGKQ